MSADWKRYTKDMSDVVLTRKVSESQSERNEFIMPGFANGMGNLFGGMLMQWMDLVGAMSATRHARTYTVTASMDHLDFVAPVHVGDLLILKSSVNRAFKTSMEVGGEGDGGGYPEAEAAACELGLHYVCGRWIRKGRAWWCRNWSWRRIISVGGGRMRDGGGRCGRGRRCGRRGFGSC